MFQQVKGKTIRHGVPERWKVFNSQFCFSQIGRGEEKKGRGTVRDTNTYPNIGGHMTIPKDVSHVFTASITNFAKVTLGDISREKEVHCFESILGRKPKKIPDSGISFNFPDPSPIIKGGECRQNF